MNLWQRLTQFFGGQPAEKRAQLSETENEFLVGATPLAATEFDRPALSRFQAGAAAAMFGRVAHVYRLYAGEGHNLLLYLVCLTWSTRILD